MESNNDVKDFKIKSRTCNYFMTNKVESFGFHNILLDKQFHDKISVCDISYKTLTGAKVLRRTFDKVNAFIRVYDGNRYLALFGPEEDYVIYKSTRDFLSQEIDITYAFSNNLARVKVDSYGHL